MSQDTTVLKGDKKGGLLDKLINSGQLPEMSISLTNETLLYIGVTIVVSAVVVIFINTIIKMVANS